MKNKLCFIYLWVLFYNVSFAQQAVIDSLNVVLKYHAEEDDQKVKAFNALADAYQWMQLDSGVMYADRAIALATKFNNQKQLAIAYNNKALFLVNLGNWKENEQLLQKALVINRTLGDKKGMAENYLNLSYIKTGEEKKELCEKAYSLFVEEMDAEGMARCNISISSYYYYADLKSALAYLNKSLETFTQRNNELWMGITLNSISICYTMFSDYKNSVLFSGQALRLGKKLDNRYLLHNIYWNLGTSYNNLANYPEALQNYLDALKIAVQMGNKLSQAGLLSNIGILYIDLANYKDALKYLNMGLRLSEEIGKTDYIAISNSNIGDVYLKLGKYREALEQYGKASVLCLEMKNDYLLNVSYECMARAYEKLHDYSMAFALLEKLRVLNEKLKDPYIELRGHFTYALLIKNASNRELSHAGIDPARRNELVVANLMNCLSLVKQSGEIGIERDALQELSMAYEQMGNANAAFKYYKQYMVLKDSISSSDNQKSVASLQIQYDTEKKEKQIAILSKNNRLQVMEIQRQKSQRDGLLVGCALVLLLAGITYNRYRIKQRANAQIEETMDHLQMTQDRLIEREKLAHLGKLTADVAKEIDVPISEISNLNRMNRELLQEFKNKQLTPEQLLAVKNNFQRVNNHGKAADSIIKRTLRETRKVVQ